MDKFNKEPKKQEEAYEERTIINYLLTIVKLQFNHHFDISVWV
jgi:hypothetical protein